MFVEVKVEYQTKPKNKVLNTVEAKNKKGENKKWK
jgi:hypothetical protein